MSDTKDKGEAGRQLMQQRSCDESEHRIRETFGLKDLTNKAHCQLHASPNIVIEAALNQGNYCSNLANVSFHNTFQLYNQDTVGANCKIDIGCVEAFSFIKGLCDYSSVNGCHEGSIDGKKKKRSIRKREKNKRYEA